MSASTDVVDWSFFCNRSARLSWHKGQEPGSTGSGSWEENEDTNLGLVRDFWKDGQESRKVLKVGLVSLY